MWTLFGDLEVHDKRLEKRVLYDRERGEVDKLNPQTEWLRSLVNWHLQARHSLYTVSV